MGAAPNWKPKTIEVTTRLAELVTGGGKSRRWLVAAAVIAAVWIGGRIATSSLTSYVPPGSVGLRQVYYGGGAGIHPDPYGPGLHFIIAGIERLHLFPRTVQTINFSGGSNEVSARFRSTPPIKIQTSDGYNVTLDVSVLYKIVDPMRVLTEAGPGNAFQDRLVIPRTDQILRKTLGELNSEEFYQGPRRIEKSALAHEQLVSELKPFGIEVLAVLVRRYVYDSRYQELIEERKIKDQTVFLRQAEAKAAVEARQRDTIVAEGQAAQGVEQARGTAEIQKLKAQAELYRRKQSAGGKLLTDMAEAEGTSLENAALEGAGSENMVGLRMAEVLKGVNVLVLPTDGKNGVNPLNLSELIRKFEVH